MASALYVHKASSTCVESGSIGVRQKHHTRYVYMCEMHAKHVCYTAAVSLQYI